MVCTTEEEHSWCFIEIDSKNETYIEPIEPGKDLIKVKERQNRAARFICAKCGLLRVKIVEVE